MIVCLCRAVSDRKILSVIQEGASTVREVTAKCGAGGGCGACKPMIAGMLLEHRVAEATEGSASSACSQAAAPVVEAAA
ncbi:(2Fe-2S)-binding protein [Myxococcota bacterium]|nr:(2Fe-2S)-binding protein [Myxococcota bacterium]